MATDTQTPFDAFKTAVDEKNTSEGFSQIRTVYSEWFSDAVDAAVAAAIASERERIATLAESKNARYLLTGFDEESGHYGMTEPFADLLRSEKGGDSAA